MRAKIRLTVLRPDHLGDHVLFSGAWKHLRTLWPDAEITLFAAPFASNLFEYCPYIDKILPIDQLEAYGIVRDPLPSLPWFPGSGRIAHAFRLLRRSLIRWSYKTDIVLLPLRSPLHHAHHLVQFIPAKLKIGISDNPKDNSPTRYRDVAALYTSRMEASQLPRDFPEMELNRIFLQFLGGTVASEDFWPEFWTTKADRLFSENTLPKKGDIILGFAPGVPSCPEKQLPPSWYADVFRNTGLRCRLAVFGTKTESEYIQSIIDEISCLGQFTEIKNLAGKTTPRQLVECVRNCDFVFGQETGFIHIAVALKKPAICIVGGGHFNRFFPWGDPSRVYPIFNHMTCFNCEWICKYDTLRCLQEIPPWKASMAINSALMHFGKTKSSQ
jgi:ADP-heptose:LPS heptosyltransferase